MYDLDFSRDPSRFSRVRSNAGCALAEQFLMARLTVSTARIVYSIKALPEVPSWNNSWNKRFREEKRRDPPDLSKRDVADDSRDEYLIPRHVAIGDRDSRTFELAGRSLNI